MSEVPTSEAMPAIMIKMTELAGEELDSGAIERLWANSSFHLGLNKKPCFEFRIFHI